MMVRTVGCLDVDTIVAFVEARMTPENLEEMEAHVSVCASCRVRLSLAIAASPLSGKTGGAVQPPRRADDGVGRARATALGRYTVLGLLGRGGMGEVYAAYDPELDRKVALKILHVGEEKGDERSRSRLLGEAKAIAKLRHPNVVVVHDAGTIDNRVFLAMEHVDGQTLAAWLAERPRARREILQVFVAAGRGLAAAHAAGLVHRDFKPQNVMVVREGDVRVMDFGLARAIDGEPDVPAGGPPTEPSDGAALNGAVPLTRTGELVGTPLYMAPEQFRAQRANERTDQFSFCVALYQALYGVHPFASSGLGELMAAVTEGRVQPAPAKSAVPPWLRRILLRGLAADPASRWPSIDALITALSHDPARQRKLWLLGGAAVALLAGGVWASRGPRRAESFCRGGADRLAEAWELPGDHATTHPRRDATRAAFVKTGVARASETWERAAGIIDGYVGEWLRMYGDACEATHVRGEQSTDVLDLRMSCLSDRLARVQALGDVFAGANGAVVENAVGAASALPPLDRCADVQQLRAAVPLPDDPKVRVRVEVLKRDLAHVRALGDSGQCAAAAADGQQLISAAEKLGYLPLLAESLNAATSRSATDCLRPEEVVVTSERAALAGLASHDEEAAAEGAIVAAHVQADRTSQIGEARVWIDLAEAILRGMRHPPWTLESWRLKALALVREKEGDVSGALDSCQRARELIEKNQGVENLEYAILINNIGAILAGQRRFSEALPYYRQAEQISIRNLGEHVFGGLALVNQSEALNGLTRHDEARVAALRAFDIFQRGDSARFYQAVALTMLGEALAGLGRKAEAEAQLEKAIGVFGDDRSLYPCEARFALARSLWSRRETRPRALALGREARDAYQRLSDGKEKAAEVATWLAAHEEASSH
jgi:serine/threonine-protein kinase